MSHRPTIEESFDDATQRLAQVVNRNAHLLHKVLPEDPEDPIYIGIKEILEARTTYEVRRRVLMEDIL